MPLEGKKKSDSWTMKTELLTFPKGRKSPETQEIHPSNDGEYDIGDTR
jgi:hypothetical protein